jgi:hypothetical protein
MTFPRIAGLLIALALLALPRAGHEPATTTNTNSWDASQMRPLRRGIGGMRTLFSATSSGGCVTPNLRLT